MRQTLLSDNHKNYFHNAYNMIVLNMSEHDYHKAVSLGGIRDVEKKGGLILHEYAHWLQSVGTPYGFYLKLINHYEIEQLKMMILPSRLNS